MLNTGLIKLLSALVVLMVLFSPSRSARGGDDEVDKIPTRYGMAAAGAIEVILGLKALSSQIIPPTVGFANPENGAEGQVSPEAQPVSGDYLLTTNSGFGGVNAALVLGR